MDKRKVEWKVDICLLSVIVSLALYAAFMSYESVLALAVSFAAYFVDKYVSLKPKHMRDLQKYEEDLIKMEARVSKISLKMGFGN